MSVTDVEPVHVTPPGPNGAVRIKGWCSLTEVNTSNMHLFIFITFFSGFHFAEEQRPCSASDRFVKESETSIYSILPEPILYFSLN